MSTIGGQILRCIWAPVSTLSITQKCRAATGPRQQESEKEWMLTGRGEERKHADEV